MSIDFAAIFDPVQLIGYVAMALCIFAYQAKTRRYILLIQGLGCILWTLQFFLLGSYAGMLLNAVNAARNITYAFIERYKFSSSPFCLGITIAVCLSMLFVTIPGEGWLGIFPVVATSLASVAFFMRKERLVRSLYLVASPVWMVYDIINGSIGGTICEAFSIISIVIALLRFKKEKRAA